MNANQRNRAGLNSIMDARFIAVTPGGEVLPKERLVPDDPEQAVQQLPLFGMDSPIVRLYGDTAVLMTRLTTAGVSQSDEWHFCLQQTRQRLEARRPPSIATEVNGPLSCLKFAI